MMEGKHSLLSELFLPSCILRYYASDHIRIKRNEMYGYRDCDFDRSRLYGYIRHVY